MDDQIVTGQRLPLYALFSANAVSMVGNVMTMLAVPWFVLQTTGSASQTGVAAFFTALPLVIAGIFGGAVVDRLGFKRMSVVSDIASGATVACIPLLHLTVGIQFWQLLALVFLGALLDTPGVTARRSMLPDLAEQAGMRLERANAITSSIQRFATLVGPPAAGLLIAVMGASNILWLNAGTFLISAALVKLFIPDVKREADEGESGVGYFRDLLDTFHYIRSDRLIFSLIIAVGVTNFLEALTVVVWPVLAERVYGGSAFALGLILAGTGAGALMSAIAFGAIGHRLPRRATFIGGFVTAAIPFGFIALFPLLPILVGLRVIQGFGAGPLNPILDTVFQERVPAGMRGRMFGLIVSIAWIAIPLGSLASGYLIEFAGLRTTIVSIAIAYLTATLSMILIPALREMERAESAITVSEPVA
ncbi:macrolide resistance MFS transporter Mrx(A) [soil metagenome]